MSDPRRALLYHAKRRARFKALAADETRVIRELVPRALEAGMSKKEVARLAGISRPTLDEWLRD